MWTFRRAQEADWESVAALLTRVELPLDGAREHLTNFTLAFDGDQLVGTAGIERYGTCALLRSVATTRRGQGLGQALVRRVLAKAAQEGVTRIVLLTTTAADFFPRFGFQCIDRSEVPVEVTESMEFQGACPSSSTVMKLTF